MAGRREQCVHQEGKPLCNDDAESPKLTGGADRLRDGVGGCELVARSTGLTVGEVSKGEVSP